LTTARFGHCAGLVKKCGLKGTPHGLNPFLFFTEFKVNKMNKYLVDVSWTVAGSVYVEANDRDEAEDLATGINLDEYENADYVDNSFEVDSVSAVEYDLPKLATLHSTEA
jgi:hypothetical protein